ncbi:Uma2 family endonuclease [Gloeobacter violaceus]|uniref:Glr0582 protein n=1 Tax=Gloeobacter violaceus (strain ATCC 29082 / PCC 7421) TaxID=251221 RepID=Q7NN32_GLOVI|nr:Uma2 family endonuclease [Gloeobacter violaceus]BAC88523.1 glr0582 [Gloeobacter violaceus PCC 7421]
MAGVSVGPRPFTVGEYHRMAEAGVFAPEENVELLEGRIIAMPPQGPLHASTVRRLLNALLALGLRMDRLLIEQPITLGENGEPVPDITVVEPDPENRFYAGGHPGANRVLLVIEVSDSTLDYDLGEKRGAYARAGIGEYWVVDVRGRRVHRHTEPIESNYADTSVHSQTDVLPLLGGSIPLHELFSD